MYLIKIELQLILYKLITIISINIFQKNKKIIISIKKQKKIPTLNIQKIKQKKMHSKLSMKNLHSFGKQNIFSGQRSTSRTKSIGKFQGQGSSEIYHNPFNSSNLGNNKIKNCKKSQQQYQSGYFKCMDSGIASHRPKTNSKHIVNSMYVNKPQPQPNPSPLQQQYSQTSITHLLKNQSQCIQSFKQKIEQNKSKLNKDFQNFKQTINNIIQDLKLTISAQIDYQYKNFVTQLKNIKIGYINYCNIKAEFWGMRQGQIERVEKKNCRLGQKLIYAGMINKQNINNQQLLTHLFEDIKQCNKNINYCQFSQIQQKILKPLLKTAKYLVDRLNAQSYYCMENTRDILNDLKKEIQFDVHKMYEKIDLFVVKGDDGKCMRQMGKQKQGGILQKNRIQQYDNKANTERIRSPTNYYQQQDRRNNFQNNNVYQIKKINIQNKDKQLQKNRQKQKQKIRITISQNKKQNKLLYSQQLQKQPITHSYHNTQYQNIKKQTNYSTSHSQFKDTHKPITQSDHNNQPLYKLSNSSNKFYSTLKTNDSKNKNIQQPTFNYSKQSKYVTKNMNMNKQLRKSQQKVQKIMIGYNQSIVDSNKVNKYDNTSFSETALCVLYIPHNKLAVGTKNGIIKIFCTQTNKKITQLYGHHASICSLAYLPTFSSPQYTYIASGGDIGCCQLILWNIDKEDIYYNYNNIHKAAITCIVDIKDSKHIVSGSFDCWIHVYNYRNKQVVSSINTGQKITTLAYMNVEGYNNNSYGQNKNSQLMLINGNLNSQICIWKLVKSNNGFNNIIGIQGIKKINIQTYPYAIMVVNNKYKYGTINESAIVNNDSRDINGDIMVIGQDNIVRLVNIGKERVHKMPDLGHIGELIAIQGQSKQQLILGYGQDGRISLINPYSPNPTYSTQQPTKKPDNILSYKCGINPKSTISTTCSVPKNNKQTRLLYIANHNNKIQTQVGIWTVSLYNRQYQYGTQTQKQNIKKGNTY